MKVVTLCGSYNLHLPWTVKCIKSWENLVNVEKPFYVVPDQKLEHHDVALFQSLNAIPMVEPEYQEKINSSLLQYPALRSIRDFDLTWRKILDVIILFKEETKILLIDTDVVVLQPVEVDFENYNFVFLIEDVPAYRGKWTFPFFETFYPCVNAGFLVINPSIIELDFLETITNKYFLNLKNHWWSEQAAWSIMFGHYGNTGVFSGRDVRVISGFKKRTAEQILDNRFIYWGSNKLIEDPSIIKKMGDNAKVIHLAGKGKDWLDQFTFREGTPVKLSIDIPKKADLFQKLMISLRLIYKGQ